MYISTEMKLSTKRGREAALILLESEEYTSWIRKRIKTETLNVEIEKMLWHYAYGKPVERAQIEIDDNTSNTSNLSTAERLQRIEQLRTRLLERVHEEQALEVTATIN